MDRNYVEEATAQGWNPDKDSQPEGKWVDAQTFVEKGERIAGIAQSQRDRDKVHYENRIQSLERSNKEFGEYKDGQLAKEREKNADLVAQLETRKAAAITDADGQEVVRIDRELRKVQQDLNVPEPTTDRPLDVLAQAWLLNNDWYNTNPKLHTYAEGLYEQIQAEGYRGPAYFAELTKRVTEAFPEEFGNKNRAGPSDVEVGGQVETKADSDAHIYENLPPDAKAHCDKFVAAKISTKDSFCESYDWE